MTIHVEKNFKRYLKNVYLESYRCPRPQIEEEISMDEVHECIIILLYDFYMHDTIVLLSYYMNASIFEETKR